MQLLYEVVENKIARDRDRDYEKKLKAASKERKYHLVQNYNNDLIRRSLKSQNGQRRLNVKENRPNVHLDKINKKLEENNKKRIAQLSGKYGHQPMKSCGTGKRVEGLEIEVDNHSEFDEKPGGKGRAASNYRYNDHHPVSSNATPTSNISYATHKSSRTADLIRDRTSDQALKEKTSKLRITNSLIQKLKQRNESRSSKKRLAKETQIEPKRANGSLGVEPKAVNSPEDRMLHLTLTGAKNNTNLVQINNYINKLHKEESEQLGTDDSRSIRQSTLSSSSHHYSNKSRLSKKPESNQEKEVDLQINASRMRKAVANPLKPQSRVPLAQPALSNLQNRNVLTLTQNLLQKRYRNE